jgi:radical SAM superfamily enzyme YgiQ (UPF0313 family)
MAEPVGKMKEPIDMKEAQGARPRTVDGKGSKKGGGALIVLTASPSEISNYDWNTFSAFLSAFPSASIFHDLMDKDYFQAEDWPNGRAKYVPNGLRKVEALLLKDFPEEDVVVCHPRNLERFVGPRTKVVGITSMNPLGLAYVDTTYSSIFGFGEKSINSVEFDSIFKNPAVRRYKPKIFLGGGGAWQIDRAKARKRYGIDTVFLGESELTIRETFKTAVEGKKVPKVVEGKRPEPEDIPCVHHASTYGVIELTRGCGRNCKFCSPTMRRKHSFSKDFIMKEVETNIKEGSKMVFANSEDIFLYKSYPGFRPNRAAIVDIFKTIADYPGVEFVQLSHASLAPVVYDQKLLEELTPVLIEKTRWNPKYHKFYKNRFISVEVGVETGSARLMKRYMKGKALPFSVDNWPELVVQSVGIYNDHDWYPLATLMTGLPDETEADTIKTLEMLDDLKHAKMFFVPLLFIPLEDCLLRKANRVPLDHLNEAQWDFIATCWRYNIDFWASDYKWKISLGALLAYTFYFRWKHGRKIRYPMLKLIGMPDIEKVIRGRIYGGCQPDLCGPGEQPGKQSSSKKGKGPRTKERTKARTKVGRLLKGRN